MAERRLSSLEGDCKASKDRASSLEAREREARQKAHTAAAELLKVRALLIRVGETGYVKEL